MGETVEPEKLYYKKQEDDRDVYSRNEEAVARKRSNLNETEEEQLWQFTMSAGEQKQNSAPALEEEMENSQQRNDINKLKEKTESTLFGYRIRYWKKTQDWNWRRV